jgi:hypothetical protein
VRGRPRGTTALSDWELDELRALRRGGWSKAALAVTYGVSERTVSRYLRAAQDADSRHAGRRVD